MRTELRSESKNILGKFLKKYFKIADFLKYLFQLLKITYFQIFFKKCSQSIVFDFLAFLDSDRNSVHVEKIS